MKENISKLVLVSVWVSAVPASTTTMESHSLSFLTLWEKPTKKSSENVLFWVSVWPLPVDPVKNYNKLPSLELSIRTYPFERAPTQPSLLVLALWASAMEMSLRPLSQLLWKENRVNSMNILPSTSESAWLCSSWDNKTNARLLLKPYRWSNILLRNLYRLWLSVVPTWELEMSSKFNS